VSCESNHEELAHLFFACQFAIQVWRLSRLWSQVNNAISDAGSTIDVIFVLIEVLPTAQKHIFAATM
jgi:hypothetical protein